MAIDVWNSRWLGIRFRPEPELGPFLERAVSQQDDDLTVTAAVLDDAESRRFFGVSLARRGMQPIWLKVVNRSERPYRLSLTSIDPTYYPPLEAAYLNHFRILRRLLGYGLLIWFFLPLLLLLPIKIIAVAAGNRRMNALFQQFGIGWGILRPGKELSGFVFTSRDEGVKQFTVRLLSEAGAKEFNFAIPVPGLKVDYGHREFDSLYAPGTCQECSEDELRERLQALVRCTSNRHGQREGDPLNLVAIGEFQTILNGFGARWDETEVISLRSCIRTFRAFMLSSTYRYSPISSLFVEGRSQDFALQKARRTINQRLHLRLWIAPLKFQGKPVWIGQISRDIGVRFTTKTWNLTTHKIDPDVDDARDNVLDDLLEAGHVEMAGYVQGVGAADMKTPRRNLTGDPYFTDGLRAVVMFAESRTKPKLLKWA